MNAQSFGSIKQIAYLVDDLEASVANWTRYSGIGPWTLYKNVTLAGWWKGQDTTIVMDVGLSYQDELQIEIIRPVSKTISPYQHDDGRTKIGMHHMAWMTDDFDADVAKARSRGLTMCFTASNAASKVAYFENPNEPGILFEFIQVNPVIQQAFDDGVAASRNWDGREAILQIVDFAAF
jgi:catechol 2,3-dioxygenase-like lactoylglutathione lyase family enzyme